MGKVGVAEIMVEREGGEREMTIKKERKTKGKAFFFQLLPLISSSSGHGIHSYL